MATKFKLIFLLVQVFIFETKGKPSTKTCESFSYKGYSCVQAHECKTSVCPGLDVGDANVPPVDIRNAFTPDFCEEEKVETLISTCLDVRSVLEEQVCCHKDHLVKIGVLEPPKGYQCGKHETQDDVIRSSITASTGQNEWPYMCGVFRKTPVYSVNDFLAGGSLIAPGIILTAAHKVYDEEDPKKLVVRCNLQNITTENGVVSNVDSITYHPAFEESSLRNNFALLHLSSDFDISTGPINPICLPDLKLGDEEIDEKECFATGWGKESKGSHSHISDTLKKIKVPIVERDDCIKKIKARKGSQFVFHTSFICAGGEKSIDTCEGDGGGPLFCQRKSKPKDHNQDIFVQVGIVSWGIGCGEPNLPGIYSSTRHGLCFIDWTTRCLHGDKYSKFFDYKKECGNWAENEVFRFEKQMKRFEIAKIVEKDETKLSYLDKDIAQFKKTLNRFQDLTKLCKNLDQSDQVDVDENDVSIEIKLDERKGLSKTKDSNESEDDDGPRSIFDPPPEK